MQNLKQYIEKEIYIKKKNCTHCSAVGGAVKSSAVQHIAVHWALMNIMNSNAHITITFSSPNWCTCSLSVQKFCFAWLTNYISSLIALSLLSLLCYHYNICSGVQCSKEIFFSSFFLFLFVGNKFYLWVCTKHFIVALFVYCFLLFTDK